MTIAINGSGTITGISQGGLNDNIITKAEMATGSAWAPAGTVVQVVSGATKTYFTSASTTYVDVTNITASITPTSATSKILVKIGLNGLTTNTGTATAYEGSFQLTDGSGTLITGVYNGLLPGGNGTISLGSVTYEFLHSPATTSALTYKIQGKGDASSHGFDVNNYYGTSSYTGSYITLMEIAQ